jgi:hypothetical protein
VSTEEVGTTSVRYFHRIGGGEIQNLRLKPKEAKLTIPGISMILANSPEEAVRIFRSAFPEFLELQEAAKTIGTTTEELIRSVGFAIMHKPSRKVVVHYRLIHPDGAIGFSDENLARLSNVITNTTGY